MRASTLLIPIGLLLMAAGCAEPMTSSDSRDPVFAKGGPAPPPPPVYLEWDDGFTTVIGPDTVPAGIRGDARLADGSPSAGNSAYQGGLCGVNASLTTEVQWDLYNATGCGPARVVLFWLSGAGGPATAVQTKSIARDLTSMAIGESRTDQFEGFHLGQPNCARAEFNTAYAGSDNPRRTRLADAPDGARQWRIESQGSHQAMCLYTAKGHTQASGLTVAMPWAYTIREIK